jgi:transposase
VRSRYTQEFKLEAVRLGKSGQSLSVTAATLVIAVPTLHHWVKADRQGQLIGANRKPVSAEQMEWHD